MTSVANLIIPSTSGKFQKVYANLIDENDNAIAEDSAVQVSYTGVTTCLAEYVGRAEPGTSTAVAKWQIKRLDYDTSENMTAVLWADGDVLFNNVWANRDSLNYS